ncbi:cytochrome P450 [Streptomyces pseudovenezuelae]|uniref:cytochrome P450 n=1 Tax=Streptomyces pseudovenezuelae TaxID=67350 RepID=UPI0034A2107D
MAGYREQFGPVVRFALPGRPVVLMADPAGIRTALHSGPDTVTKGCPAGARSVYDRLPLRLLGQGMLTSSGELHQRQQRLVAPGLGPHRMAEFAHVFAEEAAAVAAVWDRGGIRDVHHDLAALALAVISRTVFGSRIRPGEVEILDAALAAGNQWSVRPLLPGAGALDLLPLPRTRGWLRAHREIHEVLDLLIARGRRGSGPGSDLLDRILTARDPLTGVPVGPAQARDEAVTLLVAGHETTANALFWCLELLARHPAAQDRVRAEIRRVLGERISPTPADLPGLVHTRAALYEAFRLYPPVWLISRTLVRPCAVAGHRLPAGTVLLLSPWVTHRDPGLWLEPAAFRPERWIGAGRTLADRTASDAGRHERRYFPFAAGPRRCAGQFFAESECLLTLATLLRDRAVSPVDRRPATPVPAFTLRPHAGTRLRVSAVPSLPAGARAVGRPAVEIEGVQP